MSERIEQLIGEIANYAPPEKCHNWERRFRDIVQSEKVEAVFYAREGIYEYLYSNGALARPY